jgi:RNA polymerase sigma factor (sigma-70 family)
MEQLYQRYNRLLYSLACTMIADPSLAEDFVQEAFLSVWRYASSYSPQLGSVHNWLVSIERHCIIDYIRSLQRSSSPRYATWEELEEQELETTPDLWEEVWRLEQKAQVHTALNKLAPEQRLLIQLAFFQGWSYPEIAKMFRLPLGTVKGRIRRGLFLLKQELDPHLSFSQFG